ncbi:hypothetical protein KCU66_g70, partial [Aureobasidium melanogenum]
LSLHKCDTMVMKSLMRKLSHAPRSTTETSDISDTIDLSFTAASGFIILPPFMSPASTRTSSSPAMTELIEKKCRLCCIDDFQCGCIGHVLRCYSSSHWTMFSAAPTVLEAQSIYRVAGFLRLQTSNVRGPDLQSLYVQFLSPCSSSRTALCWSFIELLVELIERFLPSSSRKD